MNHSVEPAGVSLVPRSDDERLDADEIISLELFAGLSDPPSFEQFAESTLLRYFAAGDVVFCEGDPGGTAFYIAKSEDVLAMMQRRVDAARNRQSGSTGGQSLQQLAAGIQRATDALKKLGQRIAQPVDSDDGQSPARRAATVSIALDAFDKPKRRALLGRLFGAASSLLTLSLSNDGPCDVDSASGKALLYEGEVFGEWSCASLAPRGATVVASGDVYMLEMRRDLFKVIQTDRGYREQVDAVYRRRTLPSHLRRLEVLAQADPHDLAWIAERAELRLVEPGTVICDENAPLECAYVVRNGRVDVLGDLGLMLTTADVADWRALCLELSTGEESATT